MTIDTITGTAWTRILDQPIDVNGYGVTFLSEWLAEVNVDGNTLTVTDYDCQVCGEGENCAHQEAMMVAVDALFEQEREQDHHDYNDTGRAAMRGIL